MNIYLIRHGQKQENDKNHDALELTETGFRQADLLGRRLAKYHIERIYSSQMVRAIQTAEQINKYLKTQIVIRPDLREMHMGACNLLGWKYLEEHYPDFIREYRFGQADLPYPPDGECGEDAWQRARKVMNEIASTGLQNVAVVTHGGLIRAFISGILGIHQSWRFSLGPQLWNCGISIVRYNEKEQRFYLESFNDGAHLEDVEL
ncbi:MAG TPA: histidine phosphatase family protein [Bacillota bacterium]|nr:histidine phosphatase family protein [Bacillota bacterium]